MTILFLGVGDNPTFISRRINHLLKSGITVKVATSQATSTSEYPIVPVFKGITLRCLVSVLTHPISLISGLIILGDLPGDGLFTRFKVLIKYHRLIAERFQLIHVQWIANAQNFIWLKKLKKVPVISSARGAMLTVYPSVINGYAHKLRKSIGESDKIHCVSKDIQQACIRWGAQDKQCFVNYNGLDTSFFKMDDASGILKTNDLISVGSLMWRKGFTHQLLIVKRLLEKGFNPVHKIIGDGPDMDGLKYQVIHMGLENNVHFLGTKSEIEVVEELQRSRIFISTSSAEGLSNSVLEAASCGLPVVAYDCEGMHEVIINDQSGFIIDPGDIEGMTSNISRLLEDSETYLRFSEKARMHVLKNFEIADKVDEMIEMYRTVIDERG